MKNKIEKHLLEHLNFEVKMLVVNTSLMLFDVSRNEEKFENKTLKLISLVAWTNHFRNLYYFLKDEKYGDDIIASNFLVNHCKEWELQKAKFKINFEPLYVKINKMSSHLTIERSKYVVNKTSEWKYLDQYSKFSNYYNTYVEIFNKNNIYGSDVKLFKIPSNANELETFRYDSMNNIVEYPNFNLEEYLDVFDMKFYTDSAK